ncbi:MAG: helix-turn-helix domain-containing protein [Haloarculaceae archaeon]
MMGGGDVTSTFSLLGNETRLRIVLELGDASEPGAFEALGFSELQSRVGVEDNGNFNYHLGRLTGEFVEGVDDGYRLTLPGVYVYRALKAGPLAETPDRDRLETDVACPACGTPQEVWVSRGRGRLGCPDCGTVNYRYPLPTGGQARTDGPSLARALRGRAIHDASAMLRGFCPYCSGTVVREVGVDVEVPPEGDGSAGADRPDELTMSLACEHCRWYIHTNAAGMLEGHPQVCAFLLERGIDSYEEDPWREAEFTVDVRSESPWRARVHVAHDGERLSLDLDGDLDVLALEREAAPSGLQCRGAGGSDDGDDAGGPGVTGRGSGV